MKTSLKFDVLPVCKIIEFTKKKLSFSKTVKKWTHA